MLVGLGVDEFHAHPDVGRLATTGDSWTTCRTTALDRVPRSMPVVWTGDEVLGFGGINGSQALRTGFRVHPDSGNLALLPLEGAPSGRSRHSAVWTGSELVIWGGASTALADGPQGDGARFNPKLNQWTPLDNEGAPSARFGHAAVWHDNRMWVIGGTPSRSSDGARSTGSWAPGSGWRPEVDLPEGRASAHVFSIPAGIVLIGGLRADQPVAGGFVLRAKE
jgi:hypothetical protein